MARPHPMRPWTGPCGKHACVIRRFTWLWPGTPLPGARRRTQNLQRCQPAMTLMPPGWRRLSAAAPTSSRRSALPPSWSRARPPGCYWHALRAPGCWCWEPPVPRAIRRASLAPSRARACGTRRAPSSSRRTATADGHPGGCIETMCPFRVPRNSRQSFRASIPEPETYRAVTVASGSAASWAGELDSASRMISVTVSRGSAVESMLRW